MAVVDVHGDDELAKATSMLSKSSLVTYVLTYT